MLDNVKIIFEERVSVNGKPYTVCVAMLRNGIKIDLTGGKKNIDAIKTQMFDAGVVVSK